ncbi:hypothetical protein IFT73_17600 [Aeromicrobium sp. CFBP 8757]|uniref:hypothetical protein n=1 Tax=Aeromicrobium sp. CFBP 8757 TaxID=2775288 RepID=UPI001785DFDE|nr:hypothetical protein [Aeromicrobium sp. CFBP 8757]MBD8608673.1 hypothetical protein [Aeromicrobium sp. CFBP 8757]
MTDDENWCEIQLSEVADLVLDYELWKDDSWHRAVDWKTVNAHLAQILQSIATAGVADGLEDEIARAQQELSEVDAQGLEALRIEPITVTSVQLTSGGHRLTAMLHQQVESVPGMFHPDHIGTSIRRDQVFPIEGTRWWSSADWDFSPSRHR